MVFHSPQILVTCTFQIQAHPQLNTNHQHHELFAYNSRIQSIIPKKTIRIKTHIDPASTYQYSSKPPINEEQERRTNKNPFTQAYYTIQPIKEDPIKIFKNHDQFHWRLDSTGLNLTFLKMQQRREKAGKSSCYDGEIQTGAATFCSATPTHQYHSFFHTKTTAALFLSLTFPNTFSL